MLALSLYFALAQKENKKLHNLLRSKQKPRNRYGRYINNILNALL